MMLHIFIMIIILGIVIYQIRIYIRTKKQLDVFRDIFPRNASETFGIANDANGGTCIGAQQEVAFIEEQKEEIARLKEEIRRLQHTTLFDFNDNEVLLPTLKEELQKHETALENTINNLGSGKYYNELRQTIISSINSYLQKNRNSSADFYLIKDIVDRNCDSAEEEINTQIPVPLYCGLAGTMIGIIGGIGALWLSGGLDELLNSAQGSGSGADGIQALIGGVAVAMIASLCGIFLTTCSSLIAKDAKKECDRNKHSFLSWIQAELLPVLSTDAMSAISKMTENLAEFNNTFSQNARELKNALGEVRGTTEGQARLLEALEKLKIQKIATANIEVYDRLKGCTDEIGLIGEQLKASRQYLQKVTVLTDKLDDADNRTRMIEEMTNYFMKERANIGVMTGVVARSIGEADAKLQEAAEELKSSVATQYVELTKHFTQQREKFEEVANAQQAALEKRMNELGSLTSELKSLTAVKTSIDNLAKSAESHNKKLDKLAEAITEIAQMKASGSTLPTMPCLPKWLKITAIAVVGILMLCCIMNIVSMIFYFLR